MEFEAIVLSEIGDYLLQEENQFKWKEKGLEITEPYIVNENDKAQKIKADKLLITETALQGIQKGEFEEETIE
jgi:hypothetical protein